MKIIFPLILFSALIFGCLQAPVACTADAKICPDGSSVGRVGPDCEFAPCPQVKPGTCRDIANELKEKIAQANYCNTDSDCTIVNYSCPFVTCNEYVNNEKVPELGPLYQRFSLCSDGLPVYCAGCIQTPQPVCVNGKCISS